MKIKVYEAGSISTLYEMKDSTVFKDGCVKFMWYQ